MRQLANPGSPGKMALITECVHPHAMHPEGNIVLTNVSVEMERDM